MEDLENTILPHITTVENFILSSPPIFASFYIFKTKLIILFGGLHFYSLYCEHFWYSFMHFPQLSL